MKGNKRMTNMGMTNNIIKTPEPMKKFTFFWIVFFLLNSFILELSAQVGINNDGTAPNPSSMLDVKSSTRGVLLPRMNNAERDAIVNPVPGLIIYNSQEKTLQIYDGPFWKSLYAMGCEPQQPGMIYGNGYPECNATGIIYAIDPVPNSSYYRWTVPSDAAITSGQGSMAITVNFGTENGNVSVRAESGCGISAYTDLPIIIGVPGMPGAINGNPAPECNATGLVYSVDPVPGAMNYQWTISPNATITGG
jgi:hypothetical protein